MAKKTTVRVGKRIMTVNVPVFGDVDIVDGVHQIPRHTVDTQTGGDYGSDPLGEDENGVFRWRMVPSGDIVGAAERELRLRKRSKL